MAGGFIAVAVDSEPCDSVAAGKRPLQGELGLPSGRIATFAAGVKAGAGAASSRNLKSDKYQKYREIRDDDPVAHSTTSLLKCGRMSTDLIADSCPSVTRQSTLRPMAARDALSYQQICALRTGLNAGGILTAWRLLNLSRSAVPISTWWCCSFAMARQRSWFQR